MASVYGLIEADNYFHAMAQTWGLPQHSTKHYGQVLYVKGSVVQVNFETLDGTWLAVHDFQEYIGDRVDSTDDIYLFDGYYTKFKNGNFRMSGSIRKIEMVDLIGLGKKIQIRDYVINQEKRLHNRIFGKSTPQ